jgi:hypothetical protein
MSLRRILSGLVVALALGGASAAPAVGAKAPVEPPRITSAVAVDTRTVDLDWTAVKGAHHYVVSYVGGETYTSATSARITDLYPGDEHFFYVTAETRKNRPLGSSEWVYVATPPEGPGAPGWSDGGDGSVRLTSGSGIGCATFDLGRLAEDGTYTSLGDGEDRGGGLRAWYVAQGAGTTATYAVRCQGSGGLWSTWSEPTVVTLS